MVPNFTKDEARDLAYSLLHEPDGISKRSYEKLYKLMAAYGIAAEIQDQVNVTEGRFYIHMDDYTDPACTCNDLINDTCPIHCTQVLYDEYLHGD